MDFLDSIDLESTCRKSNRVRSWYLYEQYKSLEKIQMDAVAKLRDRSYQERLLHRELCERRARRRLCGDVGAVSRSECGLQRDLGDVHSCVTASNNDFFESFNEIQDEEISPRSDHDHDTDGTSTQGDHDCRPYIDELKSTENDDEELEECNKNSSFDSVIAKLPVDSIVFSANVSSNLADDIKQELEFVKKTIAENIDMQLETVKENMQCLEEYSRFREDSNKFDENSLNNDRSSTKLTKGECKSSKCEYEYDDESICSIQPCALPIKHDDELTNNVYTLWSKLVSFAYQVIQLNHGNCYYDYSSQFLTAVLACDVLRRGVNRMCHILQPYVSPIKYASEDTMSINTRSVKIQKPVKRKLSSIIKESKKLFGHKCKPKKSSRGVKISNVKSPSTSRSYGDKKYHSEKNWRHSCSRAEGNKIRFSEPWRSLTTYPSIVQYSDKYSSTIWPEEFSRYSDEEFWSCHTRVANPMLKLATYIDSVIKNIGDYNV
ncbi:uncharacterized protein LOC126369122 [Pectinophora gossypiella]|uniref:uncharacterized protein LOC126369122 n=1 Tax=Pectinophora gossypiella TaxID=13191 RepID=UPI00214DF181|nr:uncharacterized protein LOC126369122 [Pectinophora gossypiella]